MPFERYADDAVVHCKSERQAHHVRQAIADRMAEVGLRLHPDKTKIVYCKDGTAEARMSTRRSPSGFTFRRAGRATGMGRASAISCLVISKEALNKISATVRSWRLHLRTGHTFKDPHGASIRSWQDGCSIAGRSTAPLCLRCCNVSMPTDALIRKKYKRLRGKKKARECWQGITERYPLMFAHWKWVLGPVVLKTRTTRAV